jgi:hypothetical protein
VNVCPAIDSVPTLGDVCVFAETLYGTLPFPDPPVAPVSAIHDALVSALQAHDAPAVTLTLPLPAPCPTDAEPGEIVGEQAGSAKENWLERVLPADPPGPTAVTRASNVTPGVGTTLSSARKSTRITPLAFGVGFPRSTVAKEAAEPNS